MLSKTLHFVLLRKRTRGSGIVTVDMFDIIECIDVFRPAGGALAPPYLDHRCLNLLINKEFASVAE